VFTSPIFAPSWLNVSIKEHKHTNPPKKLLTQI
jgi:hypothetical protein